MHELWDILRCPQRPINCFLIQGTLLGAYRDKGFTPTERDIDIGFLWEDFHFAAGRIIGDLIHTGFEIRTVNRPFNSIRVINATKYGIKVDLVSYIQHEDKRFCPNTIKPYYSIVHDADLLEKHTEVELFGDEWPAPHDIERYLRIEYGDDWNIPKYDHVSKSRVYKFCKSQRIGNDFLN